MIYTELTRRAMQIAFEAHKDQRDKSGVPYIYHPAHLAEQMQNEAAICVALLHDVIEDTEVSFDELAAEGFGEDILDALKLLTHDEAMPYMDYVAEISKNPIARAVKLADLRHNSDLTRLEAVDQKALERVKKYRAALEYLEK